MQAMKADKINAATVPFISSICTTQRRVSSVSLTHSYIPDFTPVYGLIREATAPNQKFWTADRPARSPVTIATTPLRLQQNLLAVYVQYRN
jgi:hypothetical protein